MKTRLRSLVVSLALLEMVSSFATAAGPAFQVLYGPAAATGTPLTDGGKVTLGVGQTTATQVVFWIKNTGTTNLTGVSVTPAVPTDYTLSSVLANNPFSPGTSAGFTATLNPGVNASHKQVIHITTSELTANPFDIELNAPEVSVEQPAGNIFFSDQYIAFGRLGAASPSTLTFTVRNIGSATLSNLQLGYYTNPGYNHADYTFAGLDGHLKSLAPSGSLTFTLTLKSGANTNHDAKFYIPSNDGDEIPFKIHVIAPEITVESPLGTNLIDGTAFIDFSKIGGATPNTATITIKNTGSADLNGLGVSVSGAGAADYTAVSPGAGFLAPNASTSFTVTFDPASSQSSHLATLDIASTDADETHFTISLKAPEIAVEASGRDLSDGGDYDFGTEFGTSSTTVFTIRNKGSAPLTNLAASINGPSAGEYALFGPSVTTLAPNATATFNVKFTPAGPGARTAALHITSNDGDENTFDINFRGPRIQVERPAGTILSNGEVIDFGNLATGSNTLTFTLRNVGDADLKDLSRSLGGIDAADYTLGALGVNTLAPNASTAFTLTLDPASQKSHLAMLDILSNDDPRSPFHINLKAPEIAVERPAGTNQPGGSLVDFGTVSTASSSTFTFTVKNKGSSPLKNLVSSINGANALDFTFTGPALTTLAPGASSSFTIKFSPNATGLRSAAFHLANNDIDENPYNFPLAGFGMAITLHPSPQLVGVGEPATFQVAAVTSTTTPTFTWLKNGVPIPGSAAHTAIYTIPAVALTDAGSYSCLVVDGLVTISSGAARLGVVASGTTALTVNEGATITLPLSKNIPPGPAPSYLWKKNGTAFGNSGSAPNQVISGATTATASITKAAAINDDLYTCVVGMDGLTKESGPFDVTVRLKPVINAAGPFAWLVSGSVNDQITAANGPTSFTFTNLPPGVVGDKTTGHLSGKPNTATTASKTFTVTGTNAAGTGPIATIGYTVDPLPAACVGTFNGLAARSTTLTGAVAGQFTKGLGGCLSNLVVTSTGAFTATLKVEDRSYAMPAASRLDAVAGGNPGASVKILRGTASDAIPDLTFAFNIDKNTGELTGTLTDGVVATPVAVKAWHNPWIVSSNAAINHPATAASYTAALQLDPALAGTDPTSVPPGNVANLAYPQGTGYGTLSITAAGIATWSGKAADGAALTYSTTMGPGGEVALWFLLYTPTVAATAGSMQGWVKITGNDLDSVPPFDWFKQAQLPASTTRSYKSGFPLHNLTVVGGKYVPPTNVTSVLSLSAPPNNARIVFNEGGIRDSTLGVTGSLAQIFSISSTNAITMPAGLANNPGIVTLAAFSATTGAISGNFTLTDNDPRDLVSPFVTVTRSTPWSGVLVPRLGKGVGQFQLANLPTNVAPATTPSTSPQLSGNVVLKANP